jgi:hypothetical protein
MITPFLCHFNGIMVHSGVLVFSLASAVYPVDEEKMRKNRILFTEITG